MLLYEIHTRAWLAEMSEQSGRRVTFGTVPEEEIENWVAKGFTHIWLMGVWKTGPRSREVALKHWRTEWRHKVPSTEENVPGSPFAIEQFDVAAELGSWEDLKRLKERLAGKGLILIADFVPNHLGLDAPELRNDPILFVQSPQVREGTFEMDTDFGRRHFAHGRDPYFPPWEDTVQLDYRSQKVHELMTEMAVRVSSVTAGMRCDMSMLVLREIFERTWKEYPAPTKDAAKGEFWEMCLAAVREINPRCVMIAEAYWDTEERLQEMGFDFTYNKRVYDFIVRRQLDVMGDFLLEKSARFMEKGITFLENHDEPRVSTMLTWPEHKAAIFLLMSLPGMVLLHDGQLEGKKSFAPIQLRKRLSEEKDAEISSFYDDLLQVMRGTPVRTGKCELLRVMSAEPGSSEFRHCFASVWEGNGEIILALINLGSSPARARIPLPHRLRGRRLGLCPIFATDKGNHILGRAEAGELILDLPARFGQWMKLVEGQ